MAPENTAQVRTTGSNALKTLLQMISNRNCQLRKFSDLTFFHEEKKILKKIKIFKKKS